MRRIARKATPVRLGNQAPGTWAEGHVGLHLFFEEEVAKLLETLSAIRNLYGFLSQIIPCPIDFERHRTLLLVMGLEILR